MATRTAIVNGDEYLVWGDFIRRGTMAQDKDGNVKQISYSGYINNDLTVRKAIANTWNLPTFRKNKTA